MRPKRPWTERDERRLRGEMMRGFVAKAKAGDAKAFRLVLDVIAQAGPRTTLSVGIRANQAGQSAPPQAEPPVTIRRRPDEELDYEDEDDEDDEGAPAALAGSQLRGVRVKVAAVLGRIGPMTIPDVAAEAGLAPVHVGQALDRCEWFKHLRDGRFNLTSIGRREAELD